MENVEVSLSYGILEGFKRSDVCSFRGVPYATAERFQAPCRIDALPTGRLRCFEFGPACPQAPILVRPDYYFSPSGLFSVAKGVLSARIPVPSFRNSRVFSEQCLNLQIYTPVGDGPFPVLVFIHGGAFYYGANSDAQYQHHWGSELVRRKRVVLVLVNYRLGCLGFCQVPGGVANAAILDAIAALEFVQREIAVFGGDASNVTVSGESAGAMIIGAMLRTHRARGLFTRCIMMSGALINVLTKEDARRVSDAFVEAIPDFRTASLRRLLEAQGIVGSHFRGRFGEMPFEPYIDGELICEEVCHSGLEILIGVCDSECDLFVPQTRLVPGVPQFMLTQQLRRMGCTPGASAATKALVMLLPNEPGYRQVTTVLSTLFQDAPLVLGVERLSAAGNAVVPYRNLQGRNHVGELPYIFGTWDRNLLIRHLAGLPLLLSDADRIRARAQQELWMNLVGDFTRTGAEALSPWPVSAPQALYLAPEGLHVGAYVSAFAASVAEELRRAVRPWGVKMPRSRL